MDVPEVSTHFNRWVLAARGEYAHAHDAWSSSKYVPRMQVLQVRTFCQRWVVAASDKYKLTVNDPAVNICWGCTFCRWGHAAKGEYLLPVINTCSPYMVQPWIHTKAQVLHVRTCYQRCENLLPLISTCSPYMVQQWIYAKAQVLQVRTCWQRWVLAASDKYILTVHGSVVNIWRGCTFRRWGHATKGDTCC